MAKKGLELLVAQVNREDVELPEDPNQETLVVDQENVIRVNPRIIGD